MPRLPLASVALLAACGGGWPGPAMPAPLQPTERPRVAAWSSERALTGSSRIRFRFTYLEEGASAKGRGAVILVAPDSLRLDFAGALGSGRSAAMVLGDSAVWAEPADRIEQLVPEYPILWAMVGRIRPPERIDAVTAAESPGLRAWRYVTGADTLDFILAGAMRPSLTLDIRRGGRRVGRVHTVLDEQGHPVSTRLEVPSRPARLDLRFYDLTVPFATDSTTWNKPDDDS